MEDTDCRGCGVDSIIWLAGMTIFTECRCQTSRLMCAVTPTAPIWQNQA